MASFQDKIGSERPRKIEKKIIPMSSYTTSNREFLKNSKKKNNKKHHYGFFLSQNRLGKVEKERKEKKLFR